jgi:hypothetical protein
MIQVDINPGQLYSGQDVDLTIRLTNAGPGPCSNIVFKIDLPACVLRLGGVERVELDSLAENDSVTRTIRVRPEATGTYDLRSTNFSYRDRNQSSVRCSTFSRQLEVLPARVVANDTEPVYTVHLTTTLLPHDDWTLLQGTVHNAGERALEHLTVDLTGPFTVARPDLPDDLGTLPAGEKMEFSFHVRAHEPGDSVPLRVDMSCTSGSVRHHKKETFSVSVVRQMPDTGPLTVGPADTRIRILHLSANPTGTPPLRLDKELATIKDTIQRGQYRDRLDLGCRTATRVSDLTQELLDHRPQVVHLSCHGAPDGRLYLETDAGVPQPVSAADLADIFHSVAQPVECLILSACFSEASARACAAHVRHVVGMRREIRDDAALHFTKGFYQALAADHAIPDAFRMGRASVRASARLGTDHETLLLL